VNSTLLEFPYAGLSIEIVDETSYWGEQVLILEVGFDAGILFGHHCHIVITTTKLWDACINSLNNLDGIGRAEMVTYIDHDFQFHWNEYTTLNLIWETRNGLDSHINHYFKIELEHTDCNRLENHESTSRYNLQVLLNHVDMKVTLRNFHDFPKWW